MAAAVVLSGLAGYAGWVQAPFLESWLLAELLPGVQVAAGPASAFAVAVAGTAAVLCLFALGFVVPAAEDARLTAAALAKLRRVEAEQTAGALPPDEFRRAFARSRMAAAAGEFADALSIETGKAAGGVATYRAGLDPSACFSRARLVEEALQVRVFQYLPAVLWALGAVVLAFAAFKGVAALESTAPTQAVWGQARFLAEVRGGLLAATVPVAAAPLVGLLLRAVLALRGRQLAQLWDNLGTLYPAAPGRLEARPVPPRAAETYAPGLKEAIADLRREMVASHDRLTKTLAQQAEETGNTIARDVSTAGAKLIAQFTDVSRAVTQEQNAQAKEILKRTVAVFLAELERNYGNQLKDAHQILSSCAALAADIRKEFGQMAATVEKRPAAQGKSLVADLRKALDAQNEAQARQNTELAARFEQAVARLSQETGQQSRTLADLVGRMSKGVEALSASPLAASTADIAKMTAAFNDLQATLADLRSSLVPALAEVAAGVRTETAERERITALAGELGAATQAVREAAETLRGQAQEPAERRAVEAAAKGRQKVRENLGRELSEALRALREETESSPSEPSSKP
jgi:predicted  nucleic acid-binding Zn-ribbon protein